MQHETFSYLLLSGAFCGIMMVLGGILLLYKGAITLGGATADALTVEFKKELRITTQYPALGIFIIGLMFVVISAFLGRPSETQPFTIKANTIGVNEPVSVRLLAGGWNKNLQHTGQILETHHPYVDTLQIVVSAPGYRPLTRTIQLSRLENGTADLGDITLEQSIAFENLSPTIAPVPAHVQLDSLEASGQFGGTQ
ncbi:MAG: hypothetical protein QNJ29_02690 [Rhizobiaceae bacterium]|nr:hypothetical protein [Rhizobiaceae bacterium]